MKKIFSLALGAMLLGGAAFAQHSNQKVSFGLKGGLNVSNLHFSNDNVDTKTKLGFNAGLLVHLHLTPQLALQPEVYYSAQGAKYNLGTTEGKLNLGYINVPVIVQYMFDNGFRLQAGPQLGILVNAETKIGSLETKVKDDFNTIDFAVTSGVSYVHPETD